MASDMLKRQHKLLCTAIRCGSSDVIAKIVDSAEETMPRDEVAYLLNQGEDHYGNTMRPLHLVLLSLVNERGLVAALKTKLKTLQFLLDKGADPSLRCGKNMVEVLICSASVVDINDTRPPLPGEPVDAYGRRFIQMAPVDYALALQSHASRYMSTCNGVESALKGAANLLMKAQVARELPDGGEGANAMDTVSGRKLAEAQKRAVLGRMARMFERANPPDDDVYDVDADAPANGGGSAAMSNVTFLVQGEVVRAHKCILMEASPVFEAMFNFNAASSASSAGNGRGGGGGGGGGDDGGGGGAAAAGNGSAIVGNTSHINFDGAASAEELRVFLRYCYCGDVEQLQLDEHAEGLLELADMYDFPDLKKLAEKQLCTMLTLENLISALTLASLHGARCLQMSCMQMIDKHSSQLLCSTAFFRLSTDNPALWQDIRRYLETPPADRATLRFNRGHGNGAGQGKRTRNDDGGSDNGDDRDARRQRRA